MMSNIVAGTVKFFNSDKNFGFVETDNKGPDVFIHAGLFGKAGFALPNKGDRISGLVEKSEKGLAFSEVKTLNERKLSISVVEKSERPKKKNLCQCGQLTGTVKFYDPGKGFGFIMPDGNWEDIHLGATAVKESGIDESAIVEGLRLTITYNTVKRGPTATSIQEVIEEDQEATAA